MIFKSFLFGSAAAIISVSGANAAEPIAVEPEPMVEYVRICDTYGVGFYYIPGTEVCLRVSGYMRYDIGVGDLLGREGNTGDETYYKRARFQLRVDARTETDLGTLRAYLAYHFQYTTNTATEIVDVVVDPVTGEPVLVTADIFDARDDPAVEFAYIELGGFRVGATDSYFSTFTDYAGGVINDDLIPYGPFRTHQISYTFNAGNGFTLGAALEEGAGAFVLEDYTPHVVLGAGYTAGWGGIKTVAGYDAVTEEWAGKVRLDVNFTETINAFIMGGWKSSDDVSWYGTWNGTWGVWGGGAWEITEQATFNLQLSWEEGGDDFDDDDGSFAAVANVAYELVPGFVITPEVAYVTNVDDGFGDDDEFGGFLRFQRNF